MPKGIAPVVLSLTVLLVLVSGTSSSFVDWVWTSELLQEFGFLNISTDPNDVGFYLYPNPKNLSDADQLHHWNKASVVNSRYNKSNPVILLCHGFNQTYLSQFPYYVKKGYLGVGYASRANLVAVDWGKLSGQYNSTVPTPALLAEEPSYIAARLNVDVVGKRVQEFLTFLIENELLAGLDKIHLVGQGMGAHVFGMAGYYFKNLTGESVARITGTDPASPLFQDLPDNLRLDASDAEFVDIVHTNAGHFGYFGTLGTVDFFVNEGSVQPACAANTTDPFCSQNLAPRYFALSIPTTTEFTACVTPDLSVCSYYPSQIFGENCPNNASGSYYLEMTEYEE